MAADAQPKSRSEPRTSPRGGAPSAHPKHVYRGLSFGGLVLLTALSLGVASAVDVSGWIGSQLLVGGYPVRAASSAGLPVTLVMTGLLTVVTTLSLCKPRPRRILDTVIETWRSLLIVTAVVAAVSYFTRTFRLPRATLLLFLGLLSITLPTWFVFLQRWQLRRNEGTLIVGNNPERIEAAIQATTGPIVGYAFSPTGLRESGSNERVSADGGHANIPDKLRR
jgi:hypothetical protein